MQPAPKVLRRRKTQKIGDTMEKFLETFAGRVSERATQLSVNEKSEY